MTAKRDMYQQSAPISVCGPADRVLSAPPPDRTTEHMSAYPPPARLLSCHRYRSQWNRSVLAAPRGGISRETVSLLTETSPLALCAIIVLLTPDCVPMQLKAMTFHGVGGVGKKGGFTGEKQCHWCLKWGPNVISVHTGSISELLTF